MEPLRLNTNYGWNETLGTTDRILVQAYEVTFQSLALNLLLTQEEQGHIYLFNDFDPTRTGCAKPLFRQRLTYYNNTVEFSFKVIEKSI